MRVFYGYSDDISGENLKDVLKEAQFTSHYQEWQILGDVDVVGGCRYVPMHYNDVEDFSQGRNWNVWSREAYWNLAYANDTPFVLDNYFVGGLPTLAPDKIYIEPALSKHSIMVVLETSTPGMEFEFEVTRHWEGVA